MFIFPFCQVVFTVVQFIPNSAQQLRLLEGVWDGAGLGHPDAVASLPHRWQMPRGTGFSLTNLPPSHRPAGCEHLQNDHGVIVDFNTADPLIRWDSYENLSADGEGESGYLVLVTRE